MNKISHKERELWKKVADTCTPLHEKPIHIAEEETPLTLPNLPLKNMVAPAPKKEEKQAPAPEFHTDRKVLKKIKKGKLFIDARLDLHGMTQTEAYVTLKTFIQTSVSHGHKNTLIITGKGSGILQTALPRWLQLTEIKPYVSWYEQAGIQHGGSGAFYVALRKIKN